MRVVACLATFALLIAPAVAEPFHHSSGEWREYHRDWLAACPPVIDEDAPDYYGYSCFASTGSQELNGASHPAYKLSLIRNRLDGTVDIAITVSPDDGVFDEERPMTISFSGGPSFALRMGDDLEVRFNTINQFFLIGPHYDEIFEKFEDRNALTLGVPLLGKEKPVTTWLSLRGVLASLDFMSTYARKVAQY